ncbi:hypothetical protein [Streptomyces sp. NRRL F-2799]|uniref:hypothetical protein n=1 Tax=Streptomyces sp. NRRL F-2799 TaxID=1463844 RepID=UPI0018FED8E0|nr:hypothetical protein [Streptomyces sp. NRRL F-2799]
MAAIAGASATGSPSTSPSGVRGPELGKAQERWPDARGIELHQGDALTFLADTPVMFDAIYSVL